MIEPSRKIVGTGLFALDMILSPSGKLVSSGLGGSAGNVLAILAGLGWSSVPIARLGDDGPGQRLIEEFSNLNADTRYLHKSEASATPIIYQQQLEGSDDKTHSFSFSCPVCGQKHSPNLSFSCEYEADSVFHDTKANILYLDRPTKFGVELAEQYRKTNTLIVFEPSTVGEDRELFCRAIRCAHIVKYADDRLADLENLPTQDVAVEICTMGSKGLKYRAPSLVEGWVQLSAFQAPWIVDTAGAGDWCTAGLLYHLYEENTDFDIRCLTFNSLSRALRFGQALSALNCMTLGARGLVRSFSTKKITSTGHYLKESLLKAEANQTEAPSASQLAYELWKNVSMKDRKRLASLEDSDILRCCRAL